MNAKLLRVGMKVKYSNGNVVKVTHVPPLDKYEECFFSGILIKTTSDCYKKWLNKNLHYYWNSAYALPFN